MNTPTPVRRMSITIVSGLPRSGTSMMMQMLKAGGIPVLTDGLREADENNQRGYYEYEPVKRLRQENGWLAEAEGKVVKVIAQLLNHLPEAHTYHILFMERDLDEVLRSQARMLENLGQKGAKLPPGVLAKVFQKQLDAAKMWAENQSNMEVCYVPHRGVIESPESWAAKINTFLGGHLDVSAMRGVVEPALYRAR